jgi:hypothetical protein
MADRIADPWGARTPYARGSEWPVRVDAYLPDGVTADDVERWVSTASIMHSNGDALDIAVKDGRMVGVRGRAAAASTMAASGRGTSSGGRPTHRPTV